MKRRINLFLMCLVLLATSVFAAAPNADPKTTGNPDYSRPQAIFPEARHTFETVLEGTKVEHEFVVRNTGTATLEILKTESG